jgi:sulfoxide reductase heme-binding subunit YedZ
MRPTATRWEDAVEPFAYLVDASGFSAYILVVLAVAVGLAISIRQARPEAARTPANDRLHQYLLLGAAFFTALHAASVWLNPLARTSLGAVVVPFRSQSQPTWVAFGILGGYLGLVVVIAGWIRPLIGLKWWRWLHYLSFPVFVLVTLHGLGARTGEGGRALWIYGASTALVVALVLVRLLQRSHRPFDVRARWAAAVLLVAAAGAVWVVEAPSFPSWSLLIQSPFGPPSVGTSVRLASPPVYRPFPRGAFSAPFSGTVQADPAAGGLEVLVLTAHFTARVSGGFVVRLTGRPLADGGLSVKTSSIIMGPAHSQRQFRGTVTAIADSHLSAVVVNARNHHVYRLLATIRPSDTGNQVSGTVQAAPSS